MSNTIFCSIRKATPLKIKVSPGTGVGGALPIVDATKNGKVLKVIDGHWSIGDDNDTLQDISGKQDKSTLEADVAAKGFTKNTGTYSKPTEGIPKADLANDVQASLGKAETALQEHQSLAAYRTASEQDAIDATKVDKVEGKGLSTNDYTNEEKAKVNDALPKAGGTMTGTLQLIPSTQGYSLKFGNNLRMSGNEKALSLNGSADGVLWEAVKVSGIALPTSNNDAANKAYVDNAVAQAGGGGEGTVYGVMCGFVDREGSFFISDLGMTAQQFQSLIYAGKNIRICVEDPEYSSHVFIHWDYSDGNSAQGHYYYDKVCYLVEAKGPTISMTKTAM